MMAMLDERHGNKPQRVICVSVCLDRQTQSAKFISYEKMGIEY